MKKYFQIYKKLIGKFALNFELTQSKANLFLNNWPQAVEIDKFNDLKNFDVGEETKINVHSLIERFKIGIFAKFHGEIL